MAQPNQARMLELSQIIAAKTAFICSSTTTADELDAAEQLKKARLELVDATDELNNLAKDPRVALQSLAWSHTTSFMLHYITRFNIAQFVPPTEAISLTTLASLTKTNEITLQRVLRRCMIDHLFAEASKGYITHTPMTLLLLNNPPSLAWASMMPDDHWNIAAHAVDAIEKWPESNEPTETGVTLAHGTDTFYQYLAKFPAKAKRFGIAMTGFSSSPGLEFEAFATHYPWQDLPKDSVVVDVGSGIGFVSVAIAQVHPHLRFVCQDLPSTVAAAPDQVPADVKDRITFQGHDFLTPNPAHSADVYFFRFVFHNWSDLYCVRILQALIPALKAGAKILINDTALPERGEMSRWEERTLRDLDMTMLTMVNAREREVVEFQKLFEVADLRFKWVGAKLPPRSKMWEMEAVWVP